MINLIKFINSWTQGIILAVIIATIIEIILPEGNNKKYVKTVIGIYILFSIVYPLITKISNKNVDINSIINSTTKEMSKYDNNNLITVETNAYIENTYKQKLEEDIKQKIEEKGYTILELNLYIETENEEKYGQINSIIIQLKKDNIVKAETNTVNEVEEININISNDNIVQKDEEKTDISEEEIKKLKEVLNSTYSVEIEKIHINE